MGLQFANLNPDSVFTSDIGSATRLATSAPFSRYLQEAIFERSLWIRSGFLQPVSYLSNTTGARIEVPRFNPLNYTEEQIRSDDTWGTSGAGYLTSQKTSATTEYASITYRGALFSADDLSRYQTGEDALEAIRSQLSADMDRKMTTKAISHLTGLVGPGGPLAATNALNKSVTTGETDANFLNVANVTEARYLLGERGQALNIIAMHSKVAAYLEQVGQLTFSTDALATGGNIQWGGGGIGVTSTAVGYFAGMRVIVDDQMPIRGTTGQSEQFVCYIGASGSMVTGQQFPLQIEAERNLPSLQNVMAVHYSHVCHVPGTSWSAVSDNPTNADLATAGNWALTYTEPRLIPLVELTVNSPFGGTVA